MKEYVVLRNKLRKKFGFWKNPYRNPLYYWWKVKEVFKKPPLHIHIGKYTYMLMCDYIKPPTIQFTINGLGWKDKFRTPRFEYVPNILFKFFKWEIRLYWSWKLYDNCIIEYADSDAIYWETILDIVVYEKSLEDAIKDNTFLSNKKDINVRTLNLLKE